MKRIIQKDRSGCGIACVAMITNKTYESVRDVAIEKGFRRKEHIRMVKKQGGKEPLFTSTNDLRKLAEYFGVVINCKKRKKFKSWEDLPNTAIMAVKWNKKKDLWHWVVFKRLKNGKQYIVDPRKLASKVKYTRLSKFKPIAGYLPVKYEN